MTTPMPAIFFGHGNPMNALLKNTYTDGWAAIGKSIPRPKAILCVSAHWYLPGTAITAMASPRTIHDFGGFPRELYEVEYPAPGSPALARRVWELLTPLTKSAEPGIAVELDQSWGLDHGTWSVLCHVFPNADIPVVQLSIDETRAPEFHYQLGKLLLPLRDEGVLVIGSGNMIHNLHTYAWGKHEVKPFDWAVRFEKLARELLLSGNDEPLVQYEALGRDALLSAPTPDHYLPLLYVIALRRQGEQVSFPVEGFDGGSISMLTVQIG
jgi:4,5-DOPA dioxygenase extradiol